MKIDHISSINKKDCVEQYYSVVHQGADKDTVIEAVKAKHSNVIGVRYIIPQEAPETAVCCIVVQKE